MWRKGWLLYDKETVCEGRRSCSRSRRPTVRNRSRSRSRRNRSRSRSRRRCPLSVRPSAAAAAAAAAAVRPTVRSRSRRRPSAGRPLQIHERLDTVALGFVVVSFPESVSEGFSFSTLTAGEKLRHR